LQFTKFTTKISIRNPGNPEEKRFFRNANNILNFNLLSKAVEENLHNHVDGVRREKEGKGGGEESAHAGAKGGEVCAVQNVAPFSNRGLDVHVQEEIGPLGSRLFSENQSNGLITVLGKM
jgi:hypothetical protein